MWVSPDARQGSAWLKIKIGGQCPSSCRYPPGDTEKVKTLPALCGLYLRCLMHISLPYVIFLHQPMRRRLIFFTYGIFYLCMPG